MPTKYRKVKRNNRQYIAYRKCWESVYDKTRFFGYVSGSGERESPSSSSSIKHSEWIHDTYALDPSACITIFLLLSSPVFIILIPLLPTKWTNT